MEHNNPKLSSQRNNCLFHQLTAWSLPQRLPSGCFVAVVASCPLRLLLYCPPRPQSHPYAALHCAPYSQTYAPLVLQAVRKAKASSKVVLDLSVAVTDKIVKIADFEAFLKDKIKVDGKAGALADKVEVRREGSRIIVDSKVHFAKRYFKYLTRKYLQKQSLRDYLRVIASGKNSYELRYFKIANNEEE
jgi:large subunit ribosomal protein L22e